VLKGSCTSAQPLPGWVQKNVGGVWVASTSLPPSVRSTSVPALSVASFAVTAPASQRIG
jgi:hypothetical protein